MKIKTEQKTAVWMYYQPNKHKTADCSVRAISKVLHISWNEAYDILVEKGRELKEMPDGMPTIEAVLQEYGFVKDTYAIPSKGQKRMTVKDYAMTHPHQTALLRVAGHVVAIEDGYYWDIWDCGSKSIYKAYYK